MSGWGVVLLKAFLKIAGVSVLIVGIGLAILGVYGASEQNFTCTGVEVVNGEETPAAFSLRFERFAWFILWSDDDGTAWVELPDGEQRLFLDFEEAGSSWNFGSPGDPPFGRFSIISNKAMIGLRQGRVLEGACSQAPDYS